MQFTTTTPLFITRLEGRASDGDFVPEINELEEGLSIPLGTAGSHYFLAHRIFQTLDRALDVAEAVAEEVKTIRAHAHNGHLTVIYLKYGELRQAAQT